MNAAPTQDPIGVCGGTCTISRGYYRGCCLNLGCAELGLEVFLPRASSRQTHVPFSQPSLLTAWGLAPSGKCQLAQCGGGGGGPRAKDRDKRGHGSACPPRGNGDIVQTERIKDLALQRG